MEDQCVIARTVTVASGVFAPGHLGELTQIVPFEMVDAALAATGTTQARIRVLPSRVVVCLLLVCLSCSLNVIGAESRRRAHSHRSACERLAASQPR